MRLFGCVPIAAAGAGEPKIMLAHSDSSVGTAGALPAAIERVFARGDNQRKLAAADADERHLFVFMEDGDAGVVLRYFVGLLALGFCLPLPRYAGRDGRGARGVH